MNDNETATPSDEPLTLRGALEGALAEQLQGNEDAETSGKDQEVAKENVKESVEGDEESAKEITEEVKVEAKEEVKEEVKVDDGTDVPNNWNDEERKAFADIPDEIITQDGTAISLKAMKDVALHRNQELLKAFNEKAREASAAKKGSEEWNKLLDPYKSHLMPVGAEPQQWVGTILKTVDNLQRQPAAVIKQLMDAYKVSPTDLGIKTEQSEEEDPFHGEKDPKVTKIETTIGTLQTRLDSVESANVQRLNQSAQDAVATFRNERDTAGNLTHPHFDKDAEADMTILMQTGRARTLQEAYEQSPAVRSKATTVVKTPEDNQVALKKAREEAAKAKKAGKTIKTRSGTPNNRLKGLSLRDELQAGYRAQQ